jgi:CRP/FNR family transcriptional regulator, cyclic AMP receptor protein
MERSGDAEFDTWLREADQDLIAAIDAETDLDAALARAKHHGARSEPPASKRSFAHSRQPDLADEADTTGAVTGRTPTAPAQQPQANTGGLRGWHRLTDAERAALTQSGRVRTWAPGEILALQGDPPSNMFVVLHGWVRITATTYHGESTPVAARGPAEFVGELSPLSGLPRTATIQAMDDVQALVVPRDQFLAVLRRHPRISEELLRTAAIRLQQSELARMESGPAFTQRLAAVLLELALQHDPDWQAATHIDLKVTQEDLASFVRVSRRTLIRGLDDLKRLGVARTARHRVTITRPDILRDLAAGTTRTREIYVTAGDVRRSV